MCPPMRTHWRHLANTIELVLPSIHPSLQCKRQIDRFSHFCTVHGGVSSGMPWHVLSPNYCLFASGIYAPPNTCFLGPSRVHNPNGISIGSVVFAQITTESRYTLQRAAHSPLLKLPLPMRDLDPQLTQDLLSLSESTIQTASRSVGRFFAQMTAECPYTLQ